MRCPPTLTNHSVTVNNDNVFGTMRSFRCEEGYFFSDGSSERIFRCSETSQWLPSGAESLCTGIKNFDSFLTLKKKSCTNPGLEGLKICNMVLVHFG